MAPVIPRRRRKDAPWSPPFGPAQAPGAPPRGLLVAVRLYLASAAASALGGVLVTIASLRLIRPGVARGAHQTATAPATGSAFVVVVLLVLGVFGLKLLLAGRLRRGRNGARIAVLLLAVWDLLALIVRSGSLGRQFSSGSWSAAALVIEILGLVTVAAAAVLLFRPEANAWFRSPR